MSESPEDIKKHVKIYMYIGGFLIAATLFTVYLSFVDFGSHTMNMLIGMAVATAKSSLVCLFFMHLNHERSTIYKIMLFSVVFVTVMFILFSMTQGDGLRFMHFEAPSPVAVHH